MTTREQEKLEQLLRKPMTAGELAKAMGCAKPTAYARLATLGKRVTARVAEEHVDRYGRALHGPKPVLYQLRKGSRKKARRA